MALARQVPTVAAALFATVLVAQETPPEEPEILGSTAAFSLEASESRVWLEEGTLLYARPDAASARLVRIDATTELEVLATDGDWFRVRYLDRLGWVNPELPRRGLDFEASPEPLAVEPPTFADRSSERRRIAAEILGLPGPNRALGPYALMTDLRQEDLLSHLERVAGGLAASYRERFGIEPKSPEDHLVVLFREEARYRRYESIATELSPYGALGHAGAELAVLFAGEHDTDTVTSLLVHELTHLLNRSTLGETPPPWLEEGMANDLAYCRVDRRGRLRLGTLNGDVTRFGGTLHYTSALASLSLVVGSRGRREGTPLADLVALDQDAFLDEERRSLHYAESTFLLRFLLAAEGGRYAAALRHYIETAAEAEPSAAQRLEELLGEDWERVERRFTAWLERQAVALLD